MSDNESTVDFVDIIRSIGHDKFDEVFAAAPRASRTALAKRFGVKKRPGLASLSARKQREDTNRKVYEVLLAEGDPALCEELLRNWLFKRRDLLAACLDYMKIPHVGGLTEEDLTPLETLGKKETATLQAKLGEEFPPEDVYIYLRFVGVKHVAALA